MRAGKPSSIASTTSTAATNASRRSLPGSGRASGAPGARAQEVLLKCYERNVMVRLTGETIAVSPPLIVERGEIDTLFGTIGEVLARVA